MDKVKGWTPSDGVHISTGGKMSFYEDCKRAEQSDIYSIATLAEVPQCAKKEKKMQYEVTNHVMNDTTQAANEQRSYLYDRLYRLRDNKDEELQKLYNVSSPDAPKTMADLIERIKDGKFTEKKPKEEDDSWYEDTYWVYWFNWRDPADKADKPGYKTARAKLFDAFARVKDDITVLDPKDALASVRTFDEQKFN